MKNKYFCGINPNRRKPPTHDSKKLNKLLFKKVEITFKDGETKIGFLEREYFSERYIVNGTQKISFYKTNVKKIKDVSVIHNIKLLREYAYSKINGIKPFEIRLDDRNYKVGDFVKYTIPDDNVLNTTFKNRLYKIEYITHYQQKPGYIVFADKFIKEEE